MLTAFPPEPFSGREAAGVSVGCPPCDPGGLWEPCDGTVPDSEARPTTHDQVAMMVQAGITCTTLDTGGTPAELYGPQAQALLDVVQHGLIAQEFWVGAQARSAANASANRFLADSTSTDLNGGELTSAVNALAALETQAASMASGGCGQHGQLVIHASPATVTVWAHLNLLIPQPTFLVTYAGSIVVTGPGYDGSGPSVDGTEDGPAATDSRAWAYLTDVPLVRLGPVELFVEPRETVERDLNDVIVWARRSAIVTFCACCHANVEVDLCDALCVGS